MTLLLKKRLSSKKKNEEKELEKEIEEIDIPDRPRIYSAFNDWTGLEMFTLGEFCFLIDKTRKAKNEYLRSRKYTDFKDLEFATEK